MRFIILRLLSHSELGMFHAYRRLGKERSKQRAINFDGDVVDRVFPSAKDDEVIPLVMRFETDQGVQELEHQIKRQEKNWRLEGNCPRDDLYSFVDPGCLFAMVVDAGVSPASGAWAVYPRDDATTERILALGETKSLAGSSMVALHDDEAGHILKLLENSKSELFRMTATRSTAERIAAPPAEYAVSEGAHLPPNPKRLVRILASVGHSLPSAVADIIDNAISKDATEVNIQFRPPDQGHGRWMAIADNGRGMDWQGLQEAMTIGSEVDYGQGDLGKYGYGLKGASWSQTDRFTVVTRMRGRAQHHLTWDAATMDSWVADATPLKPWIEQLTRIEDHGTCVFWEDMRPPRSVPKARGTDPYTAEVQALARHLGLVFHRFLEGKAQGRKRLKVVINSTYVVAPNNPVGHPKTDPHDRKSVRIPTTKGDAIAEIQAFLLPSEGEIKEMHGGDTEAARVDLEMIGMYGKRNESQGIYVYRHDRLIQWGGWHEIWRTVDEKTKLARVSVDFGKDLDSQFDVNISKMKVSLSQQLQEEIKKLAVPVRKGSRDKFRDERPRKPGRPEKPASPMQPPKAGSPGGRGPGTPSGGGPPEGTPAPPPVSGPPVRSVRTDAFAWKITKGMSGSTEVQINESEKALLSLTLRVRTDPAAMQSLTEFLDRLDGAGVQNALKKERDE